MLWDFQMEDYHQWVYEEKIHARLPPVFSSRQVIRAKLNEAQIPAGVGLHDSSAALIPYLSAFHQPFILISTGTWCISLNPFNKEPLTALELEQDCLSFLSYNGEPVKASRLFAGNEHERFIKILANYFQKQDNYYETVAFSHEIMRWLEQHIDQTINTHPAFGASAFIQRDLSAFNTYEEGYHQLLMDIMQQQKISTGLLMKGVPVKRIFVDGGFGKNPVYMNLLAHAFADVEVYAASVSQATAIGAALAIHQSWNERAIPAGMIDLKYFSLHS
jgi:sugar (pentulose or hexulose) kinase